jgi:hypothetical protein
MSLRTVDPLERRISRREDVDPRVAAGRQPGAPNRASMETGRRLGIHLCEPRAIFGFRTRIESRFSIFSGGGTLSWG